MKQQITGTGKMNPLNEIMDKRKIFKSKALGWLNKLSDWNSDMLEREDAIFLRKAYIDAMTQFIAAKGLTLEQLTGSYEAGKLLNDARQFAALEAQKATYRDFNQMAMALNQMKRTPGVGWLIDGLMPFTKTPMNILKRGLEYSPAGLGNGIYSQLVRVGKGNISAAEAIDQIAAGMTGTGIQMPPAEHKSVWWHCCIYLRAMDARPPVRICSTVLYAVRSFAPYAFRLSIRSSLCFNFRFFR